MACSPVPPQVTPGPSQVATVSTYGPAVVGGEVDRRQGVFLAQQAFGGGAVPLPVTGIRHGRLGLGLGGGLS